MVIILKLLNIPRNYKNFFVVLSLIAIISGAIFYFRLSSDSQDLIKTYIEIYFLNDNHNSFFNMLLFNFILFFFIWIFSLSLLGSSLVAFIYFVKVFIITINVSSILSLGETNSALKAFIYVFPSEIIGIFIYAIVSILAINFSFLFFDLIFKKKEINFKLIFKNYNKAFLILFLITFINIIYQTYLNPLIIKLLIK